VPPVTVTGSARAGTVAAMKRRTQLHKPIRAVKAMFTHFDRHGGARTHRLLVKSVQELCKDTALSGEMSASRGPVAA
jgi:hypothetical protein